MAKREISSKVIYHPLSPAFPTYTTTVQGVEIDPTDTTREYQNLSGYSYPQVGTMVSGSGYSGTTRTGKHMQEPFRVLKGVTTTVNIHIKEKNGNPIKLRNNNISAVIFKTTEADVLFSKTLKIIDEANGIAELEFYWNDVLAMVAGYYQMVISIRELDGNMVPIYVGETFEEKFTIEIIDNYVDANPNVVTITNFQNYNNKLYSDQILSTTQKVSNFGVSTAVIYGTNFVGNVSVEASLDNAPSESDWFPMDLSRITGKINYNAFTGLDPYVFEGKFYWIRFIVETTSGTIDKILYSC